jgi:hypothetical protein
LARIESRAFSGSSLQSILIPRGVQFIDASAFRKVKLSSISIESGNERFVIRKGLLIDIVDHKLIRNFARSSSVIIPRDIEILGSDCFSWCRSLRSVSCESNSRLRRIESRAFSHSSLQSIVIPCTVEILCSKCFFECESLRSVSLKSNSRLMRIESRALPRFGGPITIPSAVLFIAHDAIGNPLRLSLSDEDSCPEFGQWRRVRKSGIAVDFRRIGRGGACAFACACPGLPLDLTGFEEGSVIGEASRLYRRAKDGMEIVVKAFDVSEFDSGEVEMEIANLSNLRHPLIAAPIGFAFSEGEGEMKIEDRRIAHGGRVSGGSCFGSAGVVDSDSESEGNRRNCAGASVCARPWTAARRSELGECPLRRWTGDSNRGLPSDAARWWFFSRWGWRAMVAAGGCFSVCEAPL